MDELLFEEYFKKFKLIIMLTALSLDTPEQKTNFVKTFKLDLFNKAQPELKQMVLKRINELAKTYSYLNISRV